MDDSQKIAELEQRLVLLEDELMRAQRLSSVGAMASSITMKVFARMSAGTGVTTLIFLWP